MKIPLKYGLLTALGLIVWVVAAHLLISNPQSIVHSLIGPIFFNILHFTMIFLGIEALERERGQPLRFKEMVKTGVSIAFVYALAASLFFVFVVLFLGSRWLAIEPGAAEQSMRTLLLQAFAALFFGSVFLGLIYSTVISFFLAKRSKE